MAVNRLYPLPEVYHEFPEEYRPCHPPLFDSEPSPADFALAVEIIATLDPASQRWYRLADLRAELAALGDDADA